jgi:hypothetical protein
VKLQLPITFFPEKQSRNYGVPLFIAVLSLKQKEESHDQ